MRIGLDKSLWPATCHGRWMSEDYEPGLVSVIVPTYNRERFLVEAMDSVWAQTYRPVELIVVDDGSTDNTPRVVEEWGCKCAGDEAFELRYSQQENKGAPAARNLGLIESRGEYIQYLDSDDLLLPGKLAVAVESLRRHDGAQYVYGPFHADWEASPRCPLNLERHPTVLDVVQNNVQVGAGVARRDVVLRAGPWHEELLCDQDFEYNLRFIAEVSLAIPLHEPYFVQRAHEEDHIGRHRSEDAYFESRIQSTELGLRFVRQRGVVVPEVEEALAERALGVAKGALLSGRNALARHLLLRCARTHRMTPDRRFRIAGVYALTCLPAAAVRCAYKLLRSVRLT